MLISVGLFSIKNYTTEGYELSIYDSLPFIFFICISIPLIIYIILFFFHEEHLSSLYIFMIEFELLVLTLLPVIKNYAFYPMGDLLGHYGRTYDLILSGNLSGSVYPIEHILLAIMYHITSVPLKFLIVGLKPIFLLSYFLSLFMLSRYIFQDSRKSIFIAVMGTFFYSNFLPAPSVISCLMIIWAFYFFFLSGNKPEFKSILILFSILYPFFHPLVCIVLIISLLGIDFYTNLYFFKYNIKHFTFSLVSIIMLAILLLWLWDNFSLWNNQVGNLIRWILHDSSGGVGRYHDISNIFSKYNINPIRIILPHYLISILFSFITFVFVFKLHKNLLLNQEKLKNDHENRILFFISSYVIFLCIFCIFSLVSPTVAGPERMFSYMSIIFPIYFGKFIFELDLKENVRKYFSAIFVAFIIFYSIFSMYPCEFLKLPNLQVTQDEIKGMAWLSEYKNENFNILYNHERPYRIADLILGIEDSRICGLDNYPDHYPPNHFGYDLNTSVRAGDFYSEPKYYIHEIYDEILFFTLYKSSNIFTKKDFIIFDNDYTVSQLYENNEFKIYMIAASRPMNNSSF